MLGHPKRPCRCTPGEVQRYQNRVSGPILDRIDIRVRLGVPKFEKSSQAKNGKQEDDSLRQSISQARSRQAQRYQDLPDVHCNAQVGIELRKKRLRIRGEAHEFLQRAMKRWHLSMRAYERTLMVARSIADLDSVSDVNVQHVAEALQYRVQTS